MNISLLIERQAPSLISGQLDRGLAAGRVTRVLNRREGAWASTTVLILPIVSVARVLRLHILVWRASILHAVLILELLLLLRRRISLMLVVFPLHLLILGTERGVVGYKLVLVAELSLHGLLRLLPGVVCLRHHLLELLLLRLLLLE